MREREFILNNEPEVLRFLKARYPLYHLSTVFFRDIQYGIQTFLERKNMHVGYKQAERIARDFVSQLEKKKILVQIDRQTWALHYPEFRTPPVKSAAPGVTPAAKPVAGAAPSAKPALPPLGRPPAGRPAPAPPALPPLSRPAAPPAQKGPPPAVDNGGEHSPEATDATSGAAAPPPDTSQTQKSDREPLPAKQAPPGGQQGTSPTPRALPPIKSSTLAGTKK